MLISTRPLNIAVLVSGGGTNLQAIIDFDKAGIPSAVVERKGKTQAEFESGILLELEKCRAEVIVLAGFMSILSKDFTDRYKDRIINVHPALIPSFCGEGYYGLRVHQAALSYGVKVTGATVHFVNEIADGGRIIMQKAVNVKDGDTPEVLQKRVMEEAEWKILPASLEKVCKMILKGEIK